MLAADEIPQIILFKERGRDRTLRNEYKCRASRQRVPSARVTKFVKELSRNRQPPSPRGVYSRGILLARRRERGNRFGDNVIIFLNLGGTGRMGEGARSPSWRKKIFVGRIPRKRDRESPVYTETGFVSAASAIKRDGMGENEGDREKEARNATAHSRRAHLHVT